MPFEIEPKDLSWPIKPSLLIDDLSAGNVHITLSPEIPLSSFSLKQCFEQIEFKGDTKGKWIDALREIADELEKRK